MDSKLEIKDDLKKEAAKIRQPFTTEEGITVPIILIEEIVYKPQNGYYSIHAKGFMSDGHVDKNKPVFDRTFNGTKFLPDNADFMSEMKTIIVAEMSKPPEVEVPIK